MKRMQKNMGWITMKLDNHGNFTLEILVVAIIILLILGVLAIAIELSTEKISKSVESNNIEKTITETCDYLINNPGIPKNWDDYKSKIIGLAIITEDDNVIPNSVSYFKLVELGRDYERLVTKKLFDDKFKSSMELIPLKTSLSSVKIGSSDESGNVYSVNRLVKCEFFKKYVVDDFSKEGKCNHNHNKKDYSCNYLKLFKKNLKNFDYYLLIDDSEKNNVEYSIDTTHYKEYNGEKITNTKIYLNNKFNSLFEGEETTSIIFVHLNKKNVKAVLVAVPKDFDKNKLKYDYFIMQPCNFVIKAWN